MEKVDLTKQFAHRLKDAMLAAGFYSKRSTSGVCIHTLVDITGYSTQICRKYLRGEAIPEPNKIVDIAHRLDVSPGWLLFGDEHNDGPFSQKNVTIHKNLLKLVFMRARSLYNANSDESEIADFLLSLIEDLSQINASESQSLKIIELAFDSLDRLSR